MDKKAEEELLVRMKAMEVKMDNLTELVQKATGAWWVVQKLSAVGAVIIGAGLTAWFESLWRH